MTFAESFKSKKTGVSELAFIDVSVETDPSVYVGEFAVIQKGVILGRDIQVYPQVSYNFV